MADDSSTRRKVAVAAEGEGFLPDIGPLQAYLRRKREMGDDWNIYHHEDGGGADFTWFRKRADDEGYEMMVGDQPQMEEISIYNWPQFEAREEQREREARGAEVPPEGEENNTTGSEYVPGAESTESSDG